MDERNVRVFFVVVVLSSTIKRPLEVSGYESKSRSFRMGVYLSPVSCSGGSEALSNRELDLPKRMVLQCQYDYVRQ